MTPKEQAIELFEKMYCKIQPDELGKDSESAKQCALISKDNEIVSLRWLSLLCTFDNYMKEILNLKIEELKEVKKEIEKL